MDADSLGKSEPSVLFPAVSAFIHDLIKVDAAASGLLSDLARVETETYSLLRHQNMSISPAALQVKWSQLMSQIHETVVRVNRLRPEALVPQHFGEIKSVIQSVHSQSPFSAAAKKEHNQSFLMLKKEVSEIDGLIESGAENLGERLTRFKNDFSVKYNAFFQTAQLGNDARAKAIRDIRRLIDVILRLLSDDKRKSSAFVAPVECQMLSTFFNELRVKSDKAPKPRSKTPPARTTGTLLGTSPQKPAKKPVKESTNQGRSKTPPAKRGSLSQIPKRMGGNTRPTSSTLKSESGKIKTSSSLAKVPKVASASRGLGSTLPRPTSSHSTTGARTGNMMSRGISGSLTSTPTRQKTPPNIRTTNSHASTKAAPVRAVSPGSARNTKPSQHAKSTPPVRQKSPSFSKTTPTALRTPTKSPSSKSIPFRTKGSGIRTSADKRTPVREVAKYDPEKKSSPPKSEVSPAPAPTSPTKPSGIATPRTTNSTQVSSGKRRRAETSPAERPKEPSKAKQADTSKVVSNETSQEQTTPRRKKTDSGEEKVHSKVKISSPPEERQPLVRTPTSESLDSETDQLVLAVTKAREQAREKSATLEKLQRDLSGDDFFSAEPESQAAKIPMPKKHETSPATLSSSSPVPTSPVSPTQQATPQRRSAIQTPSSSQSPGSWQSESKSPSPVHLQKGSVISPGDEAGGNSTKEKEAYLKVFKSFETRLMAFEPLMLAGRKINEFVALSKKQDYDRMAASLLLSEIDEMISGMTQMSPNGQRLYSAAKTLAQLNRLIEIDLSGNFEEPNSKTMKDSFRSVEKQLASVQDPKLRDFVGEQIERLKTVKPIFLAFVEAQTKRENVQRMRQENKFLEQDLDRIRTNISLVKGAGSKVETFDISKVDKMNHSELASASERLSEELAELEREQAAELESLSSMYSKAFQKRNEYILELTSIHREIAKLHEALASSNNAETVLINNVETPRDEVMAKLEALFQRGDEISQNMEASP